MFMFPETLVDLDFQTLLRSQCVLTHDKHRLRDTHTPGEEMITHMILRAFETGASLDNPKPKAEPVTSDIHSSIKYIIKYIIK